MRPSPSSVRAWRRASVAAIVIVGLAASGAGTTAPSASAVVIPSIPSIPVISGVITILPTIVILPVPARDVVVTVADAVTSVKPGDNVVYTITVTNNWSSGVSGVAVLMNLPSSLSSAIWSCGGSAAGAECAPGAATKTGSGSINTIASLPAQSGIAFTLSAQVSPTATGTVDVTVTAPAPAAYGDVNTANNTATDSNAVVLPTTTSSSTTSTSTTSTSTSTTIATTTTAATTTTSTTKPAPTTAATVAPTTRPAAPPTTKRRAVRKKVRRKVVKPKK